MTIRDISFDGIIENISELDSWLCERGIGERARLNRLGQIVRRVKFLVDFRKDPLLETDNDRFELMWGLMEAKEFSGIFPFIKEWHKDNPDYIKRKLEVILMGTDSPGDETPVNNESRNTLFELVLAGILAGNGVDIRFESNADLAVHTNWGPIYIECKRPYSNKSLRSNVLKAEKQLVRRLRTTTNARGAIAISVSRVINPDLRLLCGPTHKAILEKLEDEQRVVAERHLNILTTIDEKKIILALFHMSAPAEVDGKLSSGQLISAFALPGRITDDHDILEYIRSRLNPGTAV